MQDNTSDPSAGAGRAAGAADLTWERQTIEKLAFAALKEQKTARRWGIFFKLLTFAYLTLLLIVLLDLPLPGKRAATAEKHTALVEVQGVIEPGGKNSADHITSALANAFKDQNSAGVVLRINSPGGSPVQSGIVYDEIRRLREKYPDKPLHVVVEDLCASGGYYIAASADRIYVDKASLIGSIGVLMDGFGFTGAMEKLGVERRVYTAGENKAFMDPFAPTNEKHREYTQAMLAEIHQQFIDVVKKGRGKRLKETPETFSGLMWTGAKSIEMGLADAYGTVDMVARDVIKAETVIDYTERENVAERLAKRFGAAMAGVFAERLAPRAGAIR
ncbi:MAG: S49 family peptidase [Burkholderiales bacterium]|nr:S49 family peptidase [Burkholderiales bacterium]